MVDTEHTASRIMTIMNKEKYPGEITFLPLSILKSSSVQYPETEVPTYAHAIKCYICLAVPLYTFKMLFLLCQLQEAIPLISKLQYNSMFDAALQRVFGKTLICRNLEIASQLSHSDELDCVTLDG